MEFATGALGSLLPKLTQLLDLQGEYKLQKNVRKNIQFLTRELEIIHAALRNVGEVPPEQLNEMVRIWARDVRELSYDMEDVVDTFLVRVDPPSRRSSKRFIQKMKNILAVGKRHQIGKQIKDIKERVLEVAARRDRYKVDTVNHVMTSFDPRLTTLYTKATQLVGIDKIMGEVIVKLSGDDMSTTQQRRIVSIVGIGGLGKMTLAKAVYDELKVQFDCTAFVTVSRNPDFNKFLKDMLYELDNQKYGNIHSTSRDVNHLISLVREFLYDRRYFIIVDDIWHISDWEIIKCTLPDDNSACRIITTTRNLAVAGHIGDAYKIKPLSPENSRKLLYRRIFGNEDTEECPDDELAEVSDRILEKCGGVPLAIITLASLLAAKGRNKMEWYEVYNAIGTGMENSLDAENMRKILSYSYYDLPSHLRTCLLYLTVFPEDFGIKKDHLIWLWIAEGFIQCEEQGKSLFKLGQSYFNDLINRSMIQPVDSYNMGIIYHCRVHDMVLDLIRSLSCKGNFITVLSDMDHTSASTIIRRLSLQDDEVYHAITQGTTSMPQVRSLVIFGSAIDQISAFLSFRVLRVLDLQYCDLSQAHSLKYLGSLLHLRYLGLAQTKITQIPKEVGNLQFLETLDARRNGISSFPVTIVQLKHFMCLGVPWKTKVPNGIGNLKSLEELSWLNIDEETTNTVEELGLLTEIRVLDIELCTKWNDKLVESLCKLQKIQSLQHGWIRRLGRPSISL